VLVWAHLAATHSFPEVSTVRQIPFPITLLVICLSCFSSAQSQILIGQSVPAQTCSGMSLGRGASLHGFVPFPADNAWNQDISSAPVDSNSTAIINFIGDSTPLHPDFGAGLYAGQTIGIPYTVVSGATLVNVHFTAYGTESDPGPMPVPSTAPIEGYPKPGNGDRHVLVLDRDTCWLYELYGAYRRSDGTWNAASGAVWDLLHDEQRPYTWTSADAAGLSVFAGLARYDEVASGEIRHALRFTLQDSQTAFTPPASHWAGNSTNANAAPMGMRLRLKAAYDISSFPAQAQVVLAALKKYGMIMADNGSSMYIGGDPDERWNNDDLGTLRQVPASAFEVLEINPLYTANNVPTGAVPAIGSFTANPATISAGQPVTLSWKVTGASYFVVSPGVGAVRGNSVVLAPTVTTIYTLYSTNAFGRSKKTVKVTVQ
jgi:hypothetical protein